MYPRIISFSGRKSSGKTELANICLKYDYKLINFADILKKLICDILKISKEFLEKNKDNEKLYDLNNIDIINYISNETNINNKIVKQYLSKTFNSIREILQIVGTDLIRNYNKNWHIIKVKNIIMQNESQKYCIGDTRFINEKEMVEELNGECWFIIRPNMFNISNHPSEINLNWCNFGNKVIINNISKEKLIKNWNNYLNNIQNDILKNQIFNTYSKKELRNILIDLLEKFTLNEIFKYYNYDIDKIVWLCDNLMIDINQKEYLNCNKYAFLKDKEHMQNIEETEYIMDILKQSGYITEKNNIIILNLESENKYIIEMFKKILKSNREIKVFEIRNNDCLYSFECDNPFIIENIKLWDFKIKK